VASGQKLLIETLLGPELPRQHPKGVPANVLEDRLSQCLAVREADQPWPEDVLISLHEWKIKGPVKFPPGTYPSIQFERVQFGGEVIIKDATFQRAVSIVSSGPRGDAAFVFDNCTFEGSLAINGFGTGHITLQNDCHLMAGGSIAKCAIDSLSQCKVDRSLNLGESVIRDMADVEILGNLVLRSARFGANAESKSTLTRCIIHGQVDGGKLEIHAPLTIQDCEFFDNVTLEYATFANRVEMLDNKFKKTVKFANATFQAPLEFRRCEFSLPPDFHNVAKVHTDTAFTGCKFRSFSTLSDLAAYRKLRQLISEDVRSDYFDGVLFACEKRTEANINLEAGAEIVGSGISKLYDWASEYGQSVWRPLVALLITSAIFILLFLLLSSGIDSKNAGTEYVSPLDKAVGLWEINTFAPFSFVARSTHYWPTTGLLHFLSIAQTIVTLTLVTLFVLAVRRRFRKTSE